jgi:hypothetical protein
LAVRAARLAGALEQGVRVFLAAKRRGEPIGSGAVESTCRQTQCHFKRPGQYWSQRGDEAILGLETFWRTDAGISFSLIITALTPLKTEMRPNPRLTRAACKITFMGETTVNTGLEVFPVRSK